MTNSLLLSIDKLFESTACKGNVCIGLDTAAEYIPQAARKDAGNDLQAILAYNRAIIDAACGAAACFKVQIAYYEQLGVEGLRVYSQTLKYLREKKQISIADIKRGDIADTALRYAKAHFYGDFEADFVTLNPYMGMDTLTPWIQEAEKTGKGAFVLLRTSNPGRADFECQKILAQLNESTGQQTKQNGEHCFLYESLGNKLSELANEKKGNHGMGIFGAVVGCTETVEAKKIRAAFPNIFFLIPGYGAQGGGADDAALLLDKAGNGGVVNASRSILKAWEAQGGGTQISTIKAAAEAALGATITMRDAIRGAVL
ncbi:MAG: orotidine-5'-phosphate decarboxylase [Termitinemataceae bacterium]|nr:MAG: orotidine-5'-phosphate decarboxylase [Termitinemataceae bacterium]